MRKAVSRGAAAGPELRATTVRTEHDGGWRAAGANRARVKTFHGLKPNRQGKLLVSFSPIRDYASPYAIEVVDQGA